MTGYQKLKVENAILWHEVELWMRAFLVDTNGAKSNEDFEKKIHQQLQDLKWRIKREQHEDKD